MTTASFLSQFVHALPSKYHGPLPPDEILAVGADSLMCMLMRRTCLVMIMQGQLLLMLALWLVTGEEGDSVKMSQAPVDVKYF